MHQATLEMETRTALPPPAVERLEAFSYDDQTVRGFLLATYVWGIVAFLVGLYCALQLI